MNSFKTKNIATGTKNNQRRFSVFKMRLGISLLLVQLLIYLKKEQIFIKAKALVGQNVTDAKENQFPFVVSIGFKSSKYDAERRHTCTGTLISNRHVLTAAHCLENPVRHTLQIVIGSVDLQKGKSILSKDWITYNQWSEKNNVTKKYKENDIVIIKLKEEVLDKEIKPAIVWDRPNEELFYRHAILAGWGVTNNATTPSRFLRIGHVKIISNDTCARYRHKYSPYGLVPDKFVCSNAKPYVLLAQGDSGGPIIIKRNVIVGVNCGSCGVPEKAKNSVSGYSLLDYQVNLHTSVSTYKDFIDYCLKQF